MLRLSGGPLSEPCERLKLRFYKLKWQVDLGKGKEAGQQRELNSLWVTGYTPKVSLGLGLGVGLGLVLVPGGLWLATQHAEPARWCFS